MFTLPIGPNIGWQWEVRNLFLHAGRQKQEPQCFWSGYFHNAAHLTILSIFTTKEEKHNNTATAQLQLDEQYFLKLTEEEHG